MSEHFVIKNIRRSIKEAQSRKGMIVGLPEIRIAASHAEVLLREIDRLTAQLAEWYKVFGHLSKDADTAGNIINEDIAERDKLIEDQQAEIAHLTFRGSDDARGRLDAEHAMRHQRFELERLKEESSHLWVRIESGEAAAYEQGKAEARKQAAIEILTDLHKCFFAVDFEAVRDNIRHKFGLEG